MAAQGELQKNLDVLGREVRFARLVLVDLEVHGAFGGLVPIELDIHGLRVVAQDAVEGGSFGHVRQA